MNEKLYTFEDRQRYIDRWAYRQTTRPVWTWREAVAFLAIALPVAAAVGWLIGEVW